MGSTTPREAADATALIRQDRDYQSVQAKISARREPPRVMRFLVNAFERYRQRRKIGWSRPWNKAGTVIYHSFRLNRANSEALVSGVREFVEPVVPRSSDATAFVSELLDASDLMVFVFLSHVEQDGHRFERATIGLGRVHAHAPRHRDRIDIDLDAAVHGGRGGSLSRARVFVDPYRPDHPEPLFACTCPPTPEARALFERVVADCDQWRRGGQTWQHWTADYLDYFGAPKWGLVGSALPMFAAPCEWASRQPPAVSSNGS
ncbi:MAG: hypothetical protein B7733_19920 [Myxococcales bacterium FL481]|nr:MAG: hypothetical protein B7733_19920 [Myxococcales bacterium FL481]